MSQSFEDAQKEIDKEFKPREGDFVVETEDGNIARGNLYQATETVTPSHTVEFGVQVVNPYEPKKLHIAYILLIFFGAIGVHRFYQGKVGTGLLWLFTIGLFGVGVLVDIFTLNDQVLKVNRKLTQEQE